MQGLFRHLGAAFICAAVAYLGGVSAGLFASAVTGAAISIVITIFGYDMTATGAAARRTYNNSHFNSSGQADPPASEVSGTVMLLKIALASAILGLPAVKGVWFMILDMNYSFRGTPWWAFLFYIVSAITAFVILSSAPVRRIVFGYCPNNNCEVLSHAACHALALAGLLYLAFNVTDATVVNFTVASLGTALLFVVVSYGALKDAVSTGHLMVRSQVADFRKRYGFDKAKANS